MPTDSSLRPTRPASPASKSADACLHALMRGALPPPRVALADVALGRSIEVAIALARPRLASPVRIESRVIDTVRVRAVESDLVSGLCATLLAAAAGAPPLGGLVFVHTRSVSAQRVIVRMDRLGEDGEGWCDEDARALAAARARVAPVGGCIASPRDGRSLVLELPIVASARLDERSLGA
jgi:hypothetical protein